MLTENLNLSTGSSTCSEFSIDATGYSAPHSKASGSYYKLPSNDRDQISYKELIFKYTLVSTYKFGAKETEILNI